MNHNKFTPSHDNVTLSQSELDEFADIEAQFNESAGRHEIGNGGVSFAELQERIGDEYATTPSENVEAAATRVATARTEGSRLAEAAGNRTNEAYRHSKELLSRTGRTLGRKALEAGLVTIGAASLGANSLAQKGRTKIEATQQRLAAYKEKRRQAVIDKAHGEAIAEDQRRTEALQDEWLDAEHEAVYETAEDHFYSVAAGDADSFNNTPKAFNENQRHAIEAARADIIDAEHEEALAMNAELDIANAAKEKARKATIRKRARNLARIQRRNARHEKLDSAKEWAKNTRTAKAGRAIARFSRNTKNYAKGIHAAGLESVRTANANAEKQTNNVE